jgi:hypothetical protein
MYRRVEAGIEEALCGLEQCLDDRKVVIMVEQIRPTSIEESTERTIALQMLGDWSAERHEGLIRKSLVVDNLLDLRAVLADEPLLKIEIDQHLASIPGRSVVEPAWWSSTLAALTSELSARIPAEPGMAVDS